MALLTYEDIQNDPAIRTYIAQADKTLITMGFTEHSFAHVTKTATLAHDILIQLGYPEREAELARIAGFMHDIGNIVNRKDHAQSGAIMAFQILERMGMSPEEISVVVTAIGNHDESTAVPVSPVAAALILADKSDVRRSRVRNRDIPSFDIHDRVNYAAVEASLHLDADKKVITLDLTIDTQICSVMNYFEIFLGRMLLCRRAADFLSLHFKLVINGMDIM